MKRLWVVVAVIGLAATLGAQSVAELAKREKERRESLKGRHAVVVKNHDLLQVKKSEGVQVRAAEDAGEAVPVEGQGTEPATVSGEEGAAVPPSGSGAPSNRRITPRVSESGPAIMGNNAADQSVAGATLEAQLKAAQELVDLLTTKMNALRQQFEFQDAMVPGYVIQQQMDETSQRLMKAQAQEARIQAEMAKKGIGRKAPESSEK